MNILSYINRLLNYLVDKQEESELVIDDTLEQNIKTCLSIFGLEYSKDTDFYAILDTFGELLQEPSGHHKIDVTKIYEITSQDLVLIERLQLQIIERLLSELYEIYDHYVINSDITSKDVFGNIVNVGELYLKTQNIDIEYLDLLLNKHGFNSIKNYITNPSPRYLQDIKSLHEKILDLI